VFFNRKSTFLWVPTLLPFSLTCSFTHTRQTACRGFSRKTKKLSPVLEQNKSNMTDATCHDVVQELLSLLEHQSSTQVFSGVRDALSLVFCVVFCRLLFGFFGHCICLSLDLWLLVTSLVSRTRILDLFKYVTYISDNFNDADTCDITKITESITQKDCSDNIDIWQLTVNLLFLLFICYNGLKAWLFLHTERVYLMWCVGGLIFVPVQGHDLDFQGHVMIFFMFNGLKWEVIVQFFLNSLPPPFSHGYSSFIKKITLTLDK
jgi:hypothetical protein